MKIKNKTFRLRSKQAGFTLVELLVVISIIGFLATTAMVAFNNARKSSRDTIRIANVQTIQKALEMYYDEHKTYPKTTDYGESTPTGNPDCKDGFDCSYEDQDGDGKYFLDVLEEEGFLPKVPLDPINNTTYYYRYFYYTGTGERNGCEKPFYVIRIEKLETPVGEKTTCYGGTSPYYYMIAHEEKN